MVADLLAIVRRRRPKNTALEQHTDCTLNNGIRLGGMIGRPENILKTNARVCRRWQNSAVDRRNSGGKPPRPSNEMVLQKR
jgi:hypothetical protein